MAATPVIERLKALLHKRFAEQPDRIKRALDVISLAETLMESEGGEPHIVKPAALLAGMLLTEKGDVVPSLFPDNPAFDMDSFWKDILEQAGFEPSVASHVCEIVLHVFSREMQESPEYALVWDATQLVKLSLLENFEAALIPPTSLKETLKTQQGRRMAEE